MKKVLILVVALTLAAAGVAFAGIANTRHNLSTSSPAGNKYFSTNEDEICVFCHTPHGATAVPLWNRNAPAGPFTGYTSNTFNGGAIVLGAGSLNCLSCHDGVSGLNVIVNGVGPGAGRAITMNANGNVIGAGPTDLGTDLSNDHPVGFLYATSAAADNGIAAATTALNTNWINTSGATTIAGLLRSGQVECASCHEPHVENTYDTNKVSFLRNANSGSNMCLTCHLK